MEGDTQGVGDRLITGRRPIHGGAKFDLCQQRRMVRTGLMDPGGGSSPSCWPFFAGPMGVSLQHPTASTIPPSRIRPGSGPRKHSGPRLPFYTRCSP